MKKYIGVHRGRTSGRFYFKVEFSHKGTKYSFGSFKDDRECARAYDLFVIRNGFDRPTNFFKKKEK